MSYEIICPYCFGRMTDDQVHFRSEKVNKGESDILPDYYDDIDDFMQRYTDSDREDILNRYRDWAFFEERTDDKYEKFWEKYGGSTEYSSADDLWGVQAQRRPVIDPGNPDHQKYIKRQPDGDLFIRDDGMVTQIELTTGELCERRVCCRCHNPLPSNYGKNPVKFATIIGITGAGKTVYLSQLLYRIVDYSAQVGLTAVVNAPSTWNFLNANQVQVGVPMPGSTPAKQFQQPLFYDMIRSVDDHTNRTETFVLYDVAGEIFDAAKTGTALINNFAPFIQHSDGIIMLIDPMQIAAIKGMKADGKNLAQPSAALSAIHNIILGKDNRKCAVPIAVCMSKADDEDVQAALAPELRQHLLTKVRSVQKGRLCDTVFNAEDFIPVTEGLEEFYSNNGDTLALLTQLNSSYETYDFFAFSALGCKVVEKTGDAGEKFATPEGPVIATRVEEPLFWLFYQLGYITANKHLPREIYCPICGTRNNAPLPDGSTKIEVTGRFPFKRKEEVPVNRHCNNPSCEGYEWFVE